MKAKKGSSIISYVYIFVITFFMGMCIRKTIDPIFETKAEEIIITHDYSLDANMDTILKLKKSNWKKLDQAERLEVIRAIADYELVTYYGYVAHDYSVVISSTLKNGVAGLFENATKTIYIDEKEFEGNDAKNALSTVLHELTHLVQLKYIEIYASLPDEDKQLLLFRDAATYTYEFNNYVHYSNQNSDAENERYRAQLCEKKAKEHSKQRTEYYFSLIEDYTKNTRETTSKKK